MNNNAQFLLVGTLLTGTLLLAACGGDSNLRAPGPGIDPDVPPPATDYDVTIRRTGEGIPHITAADFASMGYGYGYAQAEDNLCLLAEDTLTIRGLRARYLGGEGTYTIPANGAVASNIEADFFWRSLATDEAIAPLRDSSDQEVLEASRGFVDGFNRYRQEILDGQHSGRHLACRDADWLLALEEEDMYRRYFRLAVLASSSVFVDGVANAAPPDLLGELPLPLDPQEIIDQLTDLVGGVVDGVSGLLPVPLPFPLSNELPFGSNMYALAGDTTENGESILFGNPHFPWEKTERLYMTHLQVGPPDERIEIMGAALIGLPAVLIGFNDKFAWSHTVSTAFRFSFYELTLDPLDPTRYLFDGEFIDMEARDITIDVLEQDGSVRQEQRTLYHSHYGPMLEFEVSGIPILSWSPLKAYTLRDANAENDRLLNQFFRWNRAQSFEEFVDLHASVLGTPWVNTIATGPGKPAYYGDVTVVPNVPDSKVLSCATVLTPVFALLQPGVPILDGSRASCAWDTDDDAPAPGIFGPGNLPSLTRSDWVHNCNDSYWLTHPEEPLTGFAAIIGDEESARSLRTRQCIRHIQDRLDGSDGRPGTTFDMPVLQDIVLDSSLMTERLARDTILSTYCQVPLPLLGTSGPVEVAEACAVLAEWDGTHNLDARGGHIWREFWRGINPLPLELPGMWLTPFNANDPVNTPAGLNPLSPLVELAFADGVQTAIDSGFALDAPMGDIQFSGIHGSGTDEERIPVFGGEGFEGSFTIASSRGALTEQGYAVTFGNSYIQTVTWDEQGMPVAEGFVTYSQSTDPASPFFRNMTEAYADKAWIRFPYADAEINADPALQTLRLRATAP
ncbi:MAG: penicillin acylase family protein [Alcanivorax sp.]|nr:penicillin acylase family protein [Alcanivorax sp.]